MAADIPYLIGGMQETFDDGDFPSNRGVLKCLFYQLRIERKPLKESLCHVATALIAFWTRKDNTIQTQRIDYVIRYLRKMYETWDSLNRNKRRNPAKVADFEVELDAIFNIEKRGPAMDAGNHSENSSDTESVEEQEAVEMQVEQGTIF